MTTVVRVYLGDKMEDVIRKYEKALHDLDISCKVEKVEEKDQFTYFEIALKTDDGD